MAGGVRGDKMFTAEQIHAAFRADHQAQGAQSMTTDRRQQALDTLWLTAQLNADIARLRREVRLWRRVAGAAVVVAVVMAWL